MVLSEYRVDWGEKRMCWVPGWEDHFEDGRSRSRAGNIYWRIFILWVVVEALSVDRVAWKDVESEKRKVMRTIPGWPILESKKKR